MKVDPKQKIKDIFFYNNLILIIGIFCFVCFITYFSIESKKVTTKTYSHLTENAIYGPIVVKQGQPKVCEIKGYMFGNNHSVYFSGEVLDADKETLYEFGKELWHEDGYDSEGYWSESDRNMTTKLSFTEPGTYYIQFNTDNNRMKSMQLQITTKKGSGLPHLMVGFYMLIIAGLFFVLLNRKWVCETLDVINDWLEEISDD
ncbi:MAG: hypothetical protein ACI37S_03795 [Candidatus Gastranaerophilaceae bacterium]